MTTSRRALPAWQALEQHAAKLAGVTLEQLFTADPDRARGLSFQACGMYVDLSKHRITRDIVALLLELARQCGVLRRRDVMFTGEKINTSEGRAVLHAALRAPRDATITVDGENVVPAVHEVLDRMGDFAHRVRSGQ